MTHYVQLLGSDTPNGYGGCCYYGPLEHPALRESAPASAAGSGSPTGEALPASSHVYAVNAEDTSRPGVEAITPVPTLVPSVKARIDGTLHQSSSVGGVAESAVSSSWNWSSYLAAKRPTWPRAGPFHQATLLHPRPPAPLGSPSVLAPDVTAEAGSSGSEGYILFNCPEGTQRFSSEANIKLKKVRGFFFTRWSSTASAVYLPPSSDVVSSVEHKQHRGTPAGPADAKTLEAPVGAASAVMGLPGMLFTINDAGARHATFFGPSAALDGPSQPVCINVLTPVGSRSSDGGSQPHDFSSEDACARACASPSAGGSRVTVSTGGSGAAAAGVQLSSPLPSVGLRGFLTALRFHYFQHRPMTFRQLHGVVRNTTDHAGVCGGYGGAATRTTTTTGNNQLHFVETVGEPAVPHGLKAEGLPATFSPFIHATLPLSQQSLLVSFRVSGGRRSGESESTTVAAAVSGAMISLPQPTSPSGFVENAQQRHEPCDAYVAVDTEGVKTGKGADAAASTVSFTAPTSHDVVLGYAIIVSPGSSFDAARARALGVRSGPKYGQLKQGMPVEADVDVDVADMPAASKPPSSNATVSSWYANNQSSASTRRWVHPHQVMRPTEATRHAYISLVLDGDRPEDVREAVTRLLGSSVGDVGESPASNAAAACEEAEEDVDTCGSSTVGERGGGVLQQLLREHFPHLAYYYEEDDEATEETMTAPTHLPEPLMRRRPRQLTVRHVFHLQPATYFADAERRCHHNALLHHPVTREDRDQTRSKTPPPPSPPGYEAGAPSVYAAYNAYVFADVATEQHPLHHQRWRVCGAEHHCGEGAVPQRIESGSGTTVTTTASARPPPSCSDALPAVQLSLAPSLSFTLHDMTDGADADAEAGEIGEALWSPSMAGLPWRTRHVFTSYVQRHYTAFPTALVHRYHLHHLAPSLFPIAGAAAVLQRVSGSGDAAEGFEGRGATEEEAEFSTKASGSAGAARTQRAKPIERDWGSTPADNSVGYWPYSLKLRCIPEAALQLPHASRGSKRKTAHGQQQAETAWSLRAASSTVEASSGHDTAAGADAPSPLPTLRKRERQVSLSLHTAFGPTSTAPSAASSSAATAAASLRVAPLPPPAARTQPPSAPPRHVAVMDGVASLLPYPTPASALALLSATFLRSLETSSAVATAMAAGEAPASISTPTESRVDTHNSFETSRQRAGMLSAGLGGVGGGALGFLGTGSAIPSKYRNVSGAFLELHLPAYCFPGGDGPAQPLLHGDSAHASVSAAVVSGDAPSAQRGRPPAGEATGTRREGDALLGLHSADFSRLSRGRVTADIDGSQTALSSPLPRQPSATDSERLRRGVVILDFGEGSAGQLASLCGRARGGGACSQCPPRCSSSKSPLRGAVDGHQENSGVRREGAGDHAEDTESSAPSAHLPCAASFTECKDVADARLAQFVLDIVLIFISHAHADHHLGLMSLLTLRHQYLQRDSSALPPAPKLLVVCPTEVYAFMMDVWGGTAPYTTWLHKECVFELMPPPASVLRRERLLSNALAGEESHVAGDGCRGKCIASATVANSSSHDGADGAVRHSDAADDGDVDSRRTASVTHRCHHHRHAPHISNNQPEEQHVVPTPLLHAHLTAWNRAIDTGIWRHQRQPLSQTPPPSSSEPLTSTSLAAARCADSDGDAASANALTAALTKGNVWWDAEVITVDHPANAHALLLRFPFCSFVEKVQREAAESAAGRQCGTAPLSRIPDSSRVLIFSGDTRPSSFLVERSWAFAAPVRRRRPGCADAPQFVSHDGSLANEADAGSAAEEVASTLVEKASGRGCADLAPATAVARSPTPLPLSPHSSSSPVFILLHEATFGPGFEGEAIRKKHSTLPEALRIGAAVRAEFIVLNHFSQRYPKLPGLTAEQLDGRSEDLVCQRRARASAAVPTTSAVNGGGTAIPAGLLGGVAASESAPGPSCPSQQQMVTGDPASEARREYDDHSEPKSGVEQTEQMGRPLPPPLADACEAAASAYANVSFAFDLMSVSFSDMQRGLVQRLTPTLVRLLEEYDSWGVSTTQRMRSGGGGRCAQRQLPHKSSVAPPVQAARAQSVSDDDESRMRLTPSRRG
ncbi:hypothetical protein LSCM4_07409 [Leishmania orientalis]|uniref:ribonuclease Z n=1 Tax=Leishmania orientalis TaxID=2249476 RepID=A0A836GQU6_9TRYP|nr:hypothetical protein LSCM4_07409 [Leishmania orientalis]